MKTPKVPTYGLHKPTGQARSYISGKSHYLGKYGAESDSVNFFWADDAQSRSSEVRGSWLGSRSLQRGC